MRGITGVEELRWLTGTTGMKRCEAFKAVEAGSPGASETE